MADEKLLHALKVIEKIKWKPIDSIHSIESQIKTLITDECEQDTAIRQLVEPIIGKAGTHGDQYGVPPLVDVVQAALTALESRLEKLEQSRVIRTDDLGVE